MRRTSIRALIKWISRPVVLRIKRCFFNEILVLGDSHAEVFRAKRTKSAFPGYFFNVVSVEGATVSGLKNPNSQTQALPIFLQSLKSSKATTTIILLGEVDTGFVIWYRAEKYQTSLEMQLERAVHNYENLIRDVSRRFRVICISAPLPTIEDGHIWGNVANARKEVKATQRERTALTIRFNRKIRKFCDKNGYCYISLDNESIDDNGLVRQSLLDPNPNNHHYDRDRYAEMLCSKLTLNYLTRNNGTPSPGGST